MAYAKGYFSLQISFAKKVAEVHEKSLFEVLLSHTSFYKTFRIPGWNFDENNTDWVAYLGLLRVSKNFEDATYSYYLQQIEKFGSENKKELFGCFSYEYVSDKKVIYIHFRNADSPEPGALSRTNMSIRLQELRDMFAEIRLRHPDATTVAGFSWLYNIDAYKRLFPPQYVTNMQKDHTWYKSTALWGQFLDSGGNVKQDVVERFKEKLQKIVSKDDIPNCFEFPVLEPEAPISIFYSFYNLL